MRALGLWLAMAPAVALVLAEPTLAAGPPLEILSVTVHDNGNNQGGIGNVNGNADPGEVVQLTIRLKNKSDVLLTEVSAQLEVTFAGEFVASSTSMYPNIGGVGVADNDTGFSVPISQALLSKCGGRLSLKLTVSSHLNSPVELWDSLTIGSFHAMVHETTVSAGEPGMKSPVIVGEGDRFGLFYTLPAGGFSYDLRFQRFGSSGEPGPIEAVGPIFKNRFSAAYLPLPSNEQFVVAYSRVSDEKLVFARYQNGQTSETEVQLRCKSGRTWRVTGLVDEVRLAGDGLHRRNRPQAAVRSCDKGWDAHQLGPQPQPDSRTGQ